MHDITHDLEGNQKHQASSSEECYLHTSAHRHQRRLEHLAAMRNPIRFTTVLHVWVSIGSAYFIITTQNSEKNDIFNHRPEDTRHAFVKKKQEQGLNRGKGEHALDRA